MRVANPTRRPLPERTGQPPPEFRADHDGAAEQEQPDPVAAQRRIHVLGA